MDLIQDRSDSLRHLAWLPRHRYGESESQNQVTRLTDPQRRWHRGSPFPNKVKSWRTLDREVWP